MSRRNKRRVIDANALVMGGGVGLATLEAMFNLVNTQSLLSANMIRDFEMSHPVSMQTLAGALSQILAAGHSEPDEGCVHVGIPTGGTVLGSGSEKDGASDEVLNKVLDALRKLNKDGADVYVDRTHSETGLGAASTEKLLTELIDLLHEQSHEMAKMSQQHLAVT